MTDLRLGSDKLKIRRKFPSSYEELRMKTSLPCSSLLLQLQNRQVRGKWRNSKMFNFSSADYIRTYPAFQTTWLQQEAALERINETQALTICYKHSVPNGFVASIRRFLQAVNLWSLCSTEDGTRLKESLTKLKDFVSMSKSRGLSSHSFSLLLEQEILVIFLNYFNVTATLRTIIVGMAERCRNGGSENMSWPQQLTITSLAIDIIRRTLSAGEVKMDGSRRDDHGSKRMVVGEKIHRVIANDPKLFESLLQLFLYPGEEIDGIGRILRKQAARLAEDCLMFTGPTQEISKSKTYHDLN